MAPIVNIAAYQFVDLANLASLRGELRELCITQKLRGTILLSPEGINLFVAGSRAGIDALLARVKSLPGLAGLEVKESFSEEQPFNRLLVKIKREIIAFGIDAIDPRQYSSPRLSAAELKSWLDEGRPVTLLDTRNDFEVETGTFKQALAIGIDDFRDFPSAVKLLPEELKATPIVTFCTGGIRCEKAAPYLERAGFREVYQLDGGILKYFETCGDAHFAGHCFVFDKRVALNAQLQPGELRQCFACQAILSAEQCASLAYVEGISCPHCYQTPLESQQQLLARRQSEICAATSPLPGSLPYDNVRPVSVPLRLDGSELLDFLDAMHTHLSREDWQAVSAAGRLICRGEQIQPGRIMRSGERIFHHQPAVREPDVATDIRLLHEDDALVVLHKPAPLPMHPCGRFNRNSLAYLLEAVYHPVRLRPVHRLDADTSGVVVFGKTSKVVRVLQPQFRAGSVRKTYVARVAGQPEQATFECHARLLAEPGPRGVRLPHATGAAASTRFRLLHTLADGTSLVEAEPLTGRTNQIRAHLWSLQLPILGDPIYLPAGRLGSAQTNALQAATLNLHAAAIEFAHPLTHERVSYRAELPAWATEV
jgi:RluA family pseudouridine synthase